MDFSGQPKNSKILLAFEGVRQTCYLYVNGRMAGYCENGVAPFGFDITEYVDFEQENLIAVASDNTCTRNIAFCIAETPNRPDVEPGSYLSSQEMQVPPEREGVGYFWNCNDFNSSVGGITRPVELYVKPKVYLTLPLYSNLQTGGVYVYGADFDTEKNTARVYVSAEVISGKTRLTAQARQTFLQINDGENLMDGAPYLSGDQLVMEVNALLPWIAHTSCQYDEKIHALRVEYRK